MPPFAVWKFRALMVTLLLLVAGFPLFDAVVGARFVYDALRVLVGVAALRVVVPDRRLRGPVLAVGVFAAVVGLGERVAPLAARTVLAVACHGAAAGFFGLTVAVVLRSIYRNRVVTADDVCGAFAGYLLTGLAFAHVYGMLVALAPGAVLGPGLAPDTDADDRHFRLTYFSLVTLTTVGFGDFAPATDAARGVAAVEAVVGQFYLVVLMAELIGKRLGPPPAA